MRRPLRFRQEALDDLVETQNWYASREPGLDLAFASAIAAAIDRIRHDPGAFPRVHGPVRRMIVQRFPDAICFREDVDEILVLAVHGRQDPRHWIQRH